MSYNSPQDEGYSEEPLSLRDGSSYDTSAAALPQWIEALSIDDRASEFIKSCILLC